MSLKKAVACIKKHNNFLITSHTSLEGDALGSELAFYILLKKLGKSALIVNKDNLPKEYSFLPQKSNIKKFSPRSRFTGFDCFIALDCSDLSRTGAFSRETLNLPILNIDHHISNQRFGDINWLDLQASCCSEMIYKLYKQLRIPIDRDAAILLYVGILTDTGSFRYTNTTSFTHQAAAQLLKHNINVAQVYRNIYENMAFKDMQRLSGILPRMKLSSGGKIAWFQIKRNMLKNKLSSLDLSEALLDFARAIKGVEVCVLFKENSGQKDEVRVNFRSRGSVDVNKIASFFGGGGHKAASGATIKGNIEQITRMVLARIKEAID